VKTITHTIAGDENAENHPHALVIAFGNPFRGDDGLAWRVADDLEKNLESCQAKILRTHQLTPELAQNISGFRAVIFVDAAASTDSGARPGESQFGEIPRQTPDASPSNRLSHHLTPTLVMHLAATLYGTNARGFLMTVTGQNFAHGDGLSPAIESALPGLTSQLRKFIRQVASGDVDRASLGV